MAIITTSIDRDIYDVVVAQVLNTITQTKTLTPRSAEELYRALEQNNVALAFADESLIGWIVSTPYSKYVQELGLAYIEPLHRGSNVFEKLMNCLVNNRSVTIAVTYEDRLSQKLQKIWGFELCSLLVCLRYSKGKFLFSRIASLTKSKAVLTHISKRKPIYLIRGI